MDELDKKVLQYLSLLFLLFSFFILLPYVAYSSYQPSEEHIIHVKGISSPILEIVLGSVFGLLGSITTNLVSELLIRSFDKWKNKLKSAFLIGAFLLFFIFGIIVAIVFR